MSIDQLTDSALFDLYQKDSKVKSLVDGIQRKYHVHNSQKGLPEYDEANAPVAQREIKKKVSQLVQKGNSAHSERHSEQEPTRIDYAMQLAATLAGIAFLGMYI
jgi:hypothetical protein